MVWGGFNRVRHKNDHNLAKNGPIFDLLNGSCYMYYAEYQAFQEFCTLLLLNILPCLKLRPCHNRINCACVNRDIWSTVVWQSIIIAGHIAENALYHARI